MKIIIFMGGLQAPFHNSLFSFPLVRQVANTYFLITLDFEWYKTEKTWKKRKKYYTDHMVLIFAENYILKHFGAFTLWLDWLFCVGKEEGILEDTFCFSKIYQITVSRRSISRKFMIMLFAVFVDCFLVHCQPRRV